MATCWVKLSHFLGALKLEVLVQCGCVFPSSSELSTVMCMILQLSSQANRFVILRGTSKKFAHSQGLSWSYSKLFIPTNIPAYAATEGFNFFSISYFVNVTVKTSGTAEDATVLFDITVGNAHLCAVQPERCPPERPPAFNPEYGTTDEFTNVAAIQPNLFGVSGATGLGMTPKFTNVAAIQPNPFSVSGATGPGVNSLPPTDLPSYEALVPTSRSPPATDTPSTSTRAPPPLTTNCVLAIIPLMIQNSNYY